MKQINLLPYKEQQKRLFTQLASIAAVGVLGGAGIGGMFSMAVGSQVSMLENQKNTPRISSAASVPTADPDLVSRVSQLNTLSKTEIQWSKAFAVVSSILPVDIKLTTYSYANTSSGLVLKLGGSATSNVGFANFIETLRANKRIQSVKVDAYSYLPATGGVTFTVSLTVPLEVVGYSESSL